MPDVPPSRLSLSIAVAAASALGLPSTACRLLVLLLRRRCRESSRRR